MNSSLLHLEQDSDGQHRLAILAAQLHQHPVAHLYTREGEKTVSVGINRLWGVQNLVGGLQFLRLHFPEDVVGGAKSPHLGVAHFDIRWQTDEPQAVTVPEQALGPQLGNGGVLLCNLLSGLDLLWVKKRAKKINIHRRQI